MLLYSKFGSTEKKEEKKEKKSAENLPLCTAALVALALNPALPLIQDRTNSV